MNISYFKFDLREPVSAFIFGTRPSYDKLKERALSSASDSKKASVDPSSGSKVSSKAVQRL